MDYKPTKRDIICLILLLICIILAGRLDTEMLSIGMIH